jgi:6-phosphogluconolactonase/glucosamine-6-phosphate isomerase/deaminase
MSDGPSAPSAVARPAGPDVTVVADVGDEFAERVVEAYHCRTGDRFGLALTGGPVAAQCYERLAGHGGAQIDWRQVDVFLADECPVPAVDDAPHERLVRLLLVDRVGPVGRFHSLRDESSIAATVAALSSRPLDLVHLDLGPDGRLGSVFHGAVPDPGAVVEAAVDPAGPVGRDRWCLPTDVLDRAACVVVTAVGSSVAGALAAVRAGRDVPGTRLRASRVVWLADHAAAGT